MKEKIEEISLSMERGHRRILRVLSALAVIGLFAALWKWRGLAAMEPIVEGGQRRWLLAIGASIAVSLAAQYLDTQSVWFALALAAPVLGHAVGVFNGFHGGKCIASAFGAMLALALTGVSLSGLLLLAGLYIFFSVAVKIRPHRLRSILVFALYGVSAAVFYSLHGEGALALGCGMIAVTGVLRHTRRFCVAEDEKPRISNSEF